MSKIGIVGVGAVGCACAMAAVNRGSAREIVLVDRTRKPAEAVATDMRYGTPLGSKVTIADGDYGDLAGAALVMITAGINEKAGGATDRSDPQGRLRLLDKNAEIFREIVPKIARAAPGAVILVITDPPDPLADVARASAGHGSLAEHRHLPRQLAFPGSSGGAFRRRCQSSRGSGDRRTWSFAGISLVKRPYRRGADQHAD